MYFFHVDIGKYLYEEHDFVSLLNRKGSYLYGFQDTWTVPCETVGQITRQEERRQLMLPGLQHTPASCASGHPLLSFNHSGKPGPQNLSPGIQLPSRPSAL